MNILIVSDSLPFPPHAGAETRNFNLIKRISGKCRISLAAFIRSPEDIRFVPELKKYCAEVETVLIKKGRRLSHLSAAIRLFFLRQPIGNRFYLQDEMRQKIGELLMSHSYDIVQIEHSFMAAYIDPIEGLSGCRKILTFHNINSILSYRMFRVEKNIRRKIEFFCDWILSRQWEHKISGRFDKCVTMSVFDKKALQSLNGDLDISVIPNGIDTAGNRPLSPSPQSRGILLIGGNLRYSPNLDAALYFYKNIFPLVRKKIADARLTIVGKDPTFPILRLAKDKSVTVAGYVEDIRPYYQKAALLAVPLRAGGGTRLKILESMALGRPVIATSIGCEGLDVQDGENIMIADAPKDFAECVVRLMSDPGLRDKIAANARSLVERRYDWDAISEDLTRVYEELTRVRLQ